jgi:hypothetical protein
LFPTLTTFHPASIPPQVAGNSRTCPRIPVCKATERPALATNSRLVPPSPGDLCPVCHAGGRGFESRRSPVFLVQKPCKSNIVLPVQALTTAGFLLILRTSRTGIPAESRPWPVIPASRTPGQGDRRSIMVSRKAPAHGRPRLDSERAASRLSWAAIDSASRRDLYS